MHKAYDSESATYVFKWAFGTGACIGHLCALRFCKGKWYGEGQQLTLGSVSGFSGHRKLGAGYKREEVQIAKMNSISSIIVEKLSIFIVFGSHNRSLFVASEKRS